MKHPAAYVVNGGSNTISVIDLRRLKVKKTIQLSIKDRFPHHISLSPDRKKLLVAMPEFDFSLGHNALHKATHKKGGIMAMDVQTEEVLLNLPLPKPNFNAVFSHDYAEIWSATATHSGKMYVFDANTGAQKAVFSLGADPTEIVFSTNGNYAFVALEESSFVLAIDARLKQIKKYIKVDPFPTNVWAGDDGNIYVENKNLKTISIINELTLETYEFINLDFKPGQIAYHTSLNELWVCQAEENKIAYFERKNNAWHLKSTIITGEDAYAITFSADEKTAYVLNRKGNTLSMIDAMKHQKLRDIPVGKSPNGMVLIE
ncbi:YncE family protein [Emticicia sp. C21]|nr:YncE family protein [Emticicia sp. C21]